MTRDIAGKVSAAFEGLGWNHSISVQGSDHVLVLAVNEMNGEQLLALFSVLVPNGTPLEGVSITLTSGVGVTIR
jgi:hypothetical protein